MRIRTKILLSIATSLAVSALIVIFVFSILRDIQNEAARVQAYSAVKDKIAALNLSLAGFPRQPDASHILQIKSTRASLDNLLGALKSFDAQEELLVRQIRSNAQELGYSFEKLIAASGEQAISMSAERLDVLISQLWMKTQFISEDTQRLMEISQSDIDAAQKKAGILILTLIATLVFVNAAISFFSGRSIMRVQESLRIALAEAEQRRMTLEAMMEHIPMGITIADAPDVTVTSVSRYGLEMTGKPRQQVENIPVDEHVAQWQIFCSDGITPASKEALPLTRATQHGELVEQEEWVMGRPDGSRIPVLCTAAPIRDAQGRITGGVIGWQDITQRKQAEAALRQLNENLEQKVAERTKLAETRAKQLQALAVELIDAEERERQRISKLLHEDLQQILAAARFQVQTIHENKPHFTELYDVEQMLSASIAKSRRLSHELSPTILYHSGLADSLEWLSRHMRERFGLEVTIRAEKRQELENTPLKIFIFRAVQELLFNVVKYAGVQNAQVILNDSDRDLSITISDQGSGFDPAGLEHSDPKAGLGLLSLRERANYIGGSLRIESAPKKGSRITFTIPRSLARETPKQSEPTITRPPVLASEDAHVKKEQNIRIMFVDDHKVMRQGLIRLISGQPGIHIVGEAASGQEAIELAWQVRPDVVVMDISMPEMDGIEATRRIKAKLPDVMVIGLSMHEDTHLAKAMRDAGAEDFVSKTASSAELLETIYRISRK